MKRGPTHVALRDHLIRLVPSKSDLDARAPFVLTQRDREILAAIDLHGYLTLDLIDLAFFPSAHPDDRPSSRAAYRLQQLWLWGLVERIELPVSRLIGGRRPLLHALSRRGLRLLEESGFSIRMQTHRRLDRTSELFVEHNLMVAGVWANVRALIRSHPITLEVWIADRELRARRLRVKDHADDRWLPFLPDAYFEIHYASGRIQCCLLEVDRGTHALKALRRKFRAFELFLANGHFAKTWGRDDFEVLVVVPSVQRLQNIANIAREVVSTGRWDAYLFATQDILDRLRFADAEWQCLDEEFVGLLYADLGETLPGSDPTRSGNTGEEVGR